MAHPLEKREEIRALYVLNNHTLERAAEIAQVPLPTARSWKSQAKAKGDDWDAERTARFRANGGEQEKVLALYLRLIDVLENTLVELDEAEDCDVFEKAKILTSMGDTLSKTTAMGAKLMPSVNALAIALETLKMVADDIRENLPRENAIALLERIEIIGAKLHERFS